GMEFDSVFVLGATERALPQPGPPDPFFPPGGGPDPLGRVERRRTEERRDFLSAIATSGSQHVSFPAWDANLRPCYPSPWVVELARPKAPGSATASALRGGRGATNVEVIQSPDAGLGRAPAFLNVAEWRTASARRSAARLSASGLAARADLPLGRHLQVRAARDSVRFSEFDGNIESEVAGLPLLAAGVEGRRLSPSGIESWAACPFRYLLKQLVKVEATERPEVDTAWGMSAANRGILVHDVLRRFFNESTSQQRPGPAERFGTRDRRRIEELALEEFARLEEAGATGQPLAWENERRAILADLQSFLRFDEELWTDGLIPTFFEQGFGMPGDSWEPVVVEVRGGRFAQLRGRIDRVDLGPDPLAPQSARLIDYKTSKDYPEGDFAADPVVAGRRVQPSVYAAAIRARFPGLGVHGGYWFVSAKGRFKFLDVPDHQGRLREVLEVMDRSLRAGAFQQVPGPADGPDPANWSNCRYCAFDRICPTGRDQMHERKRGQAGARIHGELSLESRS
ncbi:MAG: PD-(D/E)XK nuclease family protein, partial [Candidatus Dormibacteraceae bacterium]